MLWWIHDQVHYTQSRMLKAFCFWHRFINFFLIIQTIIIIKNFRKIQKIEEYFIQDAFLFCKTTLILFDSLQFKSIWCLSGGKKCPLFQSSMQNSAFKILVCFLDSACSPLSFHIHLLWHGRLMNHPYAMQWNAALQCHFLQKECFSWRSVKILWEHYDLQLSGLSWGDGIDSCLETQYIYFS